MRPSAPTTIRWLALVAIGAAACAAGGPSVHEDELPDDAAGGAAGASSGGAAGASAGGAASIGGAAGASPGGAAGVGGQASGGNTTGGKSGSGGQPSAGSGGQPSAGSAGQPSAGSAGQPSAGGGGQPSGGTAGQPSAGSAGQLAGGAGGSSACDAALAKYHADFDATKQGFTSSILDGVSSSWPLDEWEWGTPTAGPPACHSGAKCWGTNLSGNYAACGRAALKSGVYDLSACAGEPVALAFSHWHAFVDYAVSGQSYSDGGVIEISGDGGQTWSNVTPGITMIAINPAIGGAQCLKPNGFHVDGLVGITGASGGWLDVKVTIPAALLTNKTSVRFAYGTGVNFNSTNAATTQAHKLPGWYIDDVAVVRP